MAFSGLQWLPRAALAAITLGGSCGLKPTMLGGADSTAGAPGGGGGNTADADGGPISAHAAQAPATPASASATLTRADRRSLSRINGASPGGGLPGSEGF